MKITLTILTAAFLGIYVNAQVQNLGFEMWNNLETHVYEDEMLNSHFVSNPFNGSLDNWVESSNFGLCQTTDAYDGSYSVILHNWYAYIKANLGQTIAINEFPQSISGVFKYVNEVPGDFGWLDVIATSTAGDTVIQESITFNHQESWTPFTLNLPQPTGGEVPNELTLIFYNGVQTCESPLMTCNLLYLDDLHVEFAATNAIEEANVSTIIAFPNPTSGVLNFTESVDHLVVSDLSGRIVFESYGIGKSIRLEIPEGMYFVTAENIEHQTHFALQVEH